MKISSIENKDLVNLENCESEPIHIPGSIQPHGFLVAVNKNNTIEFCSENVSEYTSKTHSELLGKNISVLFENSNSSLFHQIISNAGNLIGHSAIIEINKTSFECTAHFNGEVIILEFEKETVHANDINDLFKRTKNFVNIIQNADSLQTLCQNVADETRTITGYDRVMIYRFDKDYNGEVFAESKKEEIESFFGLHYPHTDIPVQARMLYISNLLRLIVDVNYKPVPVYTIDNGTEKNLDMSHATLRSVSPIHVQYLHNMGVGATLTISLIHEKKLWGLITCHHYSEKYIDNKTREYAKLQGHFLTSQINVRQSYEDFDASKEIDNELQNLLADNSDFDEKKLSTLIEKKSLRNITGASGVAIMLNGQLFTNGIVPNDSQIKKLADWIINLHKSEFITDHLSSAYENGNEFLNTASGILFHSLGSGTNSIMWFRPETITEVHWAGEPEKAILKDENGLHPRKSFNLWKQFVKGKSKAWTKSEVNAASIYSHNLQRQFHLMIISQDELKYRQLSAKLQKMNDELENINWITNHDLKEPLRKIQLFASKILDKPENIPDNALRNVTLMSNSAHRMQTLITDITSYSRVRSNDDEFVTVSLDDILNSVLDDLAEEISDRDAVINISPLPVISGISFLMNQMFLNLLRNSLKFVRDGVTPHIEVYASPHTVQLKEITLTDKSFTEIILKDNGIGFESKFNEQIFKVFTRLHSKDKFGGTGVGLALCKKIAEIHHGHIFAKGFPDKGAEFRIYLPF